MMKNHSTVFNAWFIITAEIHASAEIILFYHLLDEVQ